MQEIKEFILDKMPIGVIAFDNKMKAFFKNRFAEKFLLKHNLPDEVISVAGRIFDAIAVKEMDLHFPGEVLLFKKLEGSGSKWTFRLETTETPGPVVCVFIIEEAVSARLDHNNIRRQFGLTRRETDVLRRVINGLSNRDIADELVIGEQTVKDHLSNIYMKTGMKNRFALVRFLLDSPELYLE
ncbi:MAG: helix-turn-helix transcriptional regulator [Nitrospirae bacterium]|nr:helix-turn-helix transcriptional regulator [Nitrospirota bacterium]